MFAVMKILVSAAEAFARPHHSPVSVLPFRLLMGMHSKSWTVCMPHSS